MKTKLPPSVYIETDYLVPGRTITIPFKKKLTGKPIFETEILIGKKAMFPTFWSRLKYEFRWLFYGVKFQVKNRWRDKVFGFSSIWLGTEVLIGDGYGRWRGHGFSVDVTVLNFGFYMSCYPQKKFVTYENKR
jgi:hypothetical protein